MQLTSDVWGELYAYHFMRLNKEKVDAAKSFEMIVENVEIAHRAFSSASDDWGILSRVEGVTFSNVETILNSWHSGQLKNLQKVTISQSLRAMEYKSFENISSIWLQDEQQNVYQIAGSEEFEITDETLAAVEGMKLETIATGALYNCPELECFIIPQHTDVQDNAIGTLANEVTGNLEYVSSLTIYGWSGSSSESYIQSLPTDGSYRFVSVNAGEIQLGDVNEDGTVNISDATEVLTYYAKNAAGLDAFLGTNEDEHEKLFPFADVDSDGELTIRDASAILTYYAQSMAGIEVSWDKILS